jgi:hypothetical protein
MAGLRGQKSSVRHFSMEWGASSITSLFVVADSMTCSWRNLFACSCCQDGTQSVLLP